MCPDAQLLSRLLIGELDEAEAESLEQHLCQCTLCVARAEGLSVDDPLLQDARRWAQEGTRIRVSDPVHQLIGQLRELPLRASPTAVLLRRTLEPVVAWGGLPACQPGVRQAGSLPHGPWPHVGRYRLQGELGHGGMGTVYLAEDPQLGRQVAVKVPRFGLPPEAEAVARRRFLSEAHLAAAVSHPNVCPIYDIGEDQDGPYVVLAYIDGGSLAGRLRDERRWDDLRQAVALAAQVADGLAAIHARGIIHRDLKPGNILLDGKGLALLTDFGLARGQDAAQHLTVEGTVVGTPAYMAPEQLTADLGAVDRRCDLYSLGVVLYQLLTGRLPFEGPEPHRLLYQIVHAAPPLPSARRPDLGPALEALVSKAMARRPGDRFQNAGELAEALRAWLQQTKTQGDTPLAHPHRALTPAADAPTGSMNPLRGPPPRRMRWLLLLGMGLLFSAVSMLLVGRKLNGRIDVMVWPEKHENLARVPISEPGILPLHPGDEVDYVFTLTWPAFAYVIAIDSQGKPTPLYPWKDGKWDRPPQKEKASIIASAMGQAGGLQNMWQPGWLSETIIKSKENAVLELRLPLNDGNRWPTRREAVGMETVLLLARETPLEQVVDLKDELGTLLPIPLEKSHHLAYFRNWTLWKHSDEKATEQSSAPAHEFLNGTAALIETQQELKRRVGQHFDLSCAVMYSVSGKPRAKKP